MSFDQQAQIEDLEVALASAEKERDDAYEIIELLRRNGGDWIVSRLAAAEARSAALEAALEFYAHEPDLCEFKYRSPTSGWEYEHGETACAALAPAPAEETTA